VLRARDAESRRREMAQFVKDLKIVAADLGGKGSRGRR
jgi:hypothetical protein